MIKELDIVKYVIYNFNFVRTKKNNMKYFTILTLIFLFSINTASAQKIKYKKGYVLWDGEKVMEYRIENWGTEFYLYHLGKTDEDEIVFIKANDNNTREYKDDDFNKIFFTDSKLFYYRSQAYQFKAEINKMFEKKLIDKNGIINKDKLETFVEKYNETVF